MKIQKKSHKIRDFIFIIICLLAMLIPSLTMIFSSSRWQDASASEVVAAPTLTKDGKINKNFLPETGKYFEHHFPLRGKMISALAHLESTIFSTSPTDQVVIGKEGFLYYSGTINDYLGRKQLSDSGIENAAYNLKLLEENLSAKGVQLLVAIAPNKNTLYPQYMPSRYLAGARENSNLTRLQNALKNKEIKYVDFTQLFSDSKNVRYLKTDTHWDNQGAYLGAEHILNTWKIPNIAAKPKWQLGSGFIGDLQTMLYPTSKAKEPNWEATGLNSAEPASNKLWHYIAADARPDAPADVTANLFQTVGAGQKNLYVFRDSFGNALVPMLSPNFHIANYSKLVPYDISAALRTQPDFILIERTERHIAFFATTPPELSIPEPPLTNYELRPAPAPLSNTISVQQSENFAVLDGLIPPDYQNSDTEVHARIINYGANPQESTATYYKGFKITTKEGSDYGYRFYIDNNLIRMADKVEFYMTSKSLGKFAYLIETMPKNLSTN